MNKCYFQRAIILVICLMFGVTYSYATIDMSGIVTDATGNPLLSVYVYAQKTDSYGYYSAYTNATGEYQFLGLPAGTYSNSWKHKWIYGKLLWWGNL